MHQGCWPRPPAQKNIHGTAVQIPVNSCSADSSVTRPRAAVLQAAGHHSTDDIQYGRHYMGCCSVQAQSGHCVDANSFKALHTLLPP